MLMYEYGDVMTRACGGFNVWEMAWFLEGLNVVPTSAPPAKKLSQASSCDMADI